MTIPAVFEDESGTIRFEGHIAGAGITDATNANVGAVIVLAVPLQLGTGGPIIQAGSGIPAVGGNVGDMFVRSDGDAAADTYLYECTVAGAAGAATWTALVTS